jgi:hypothetical protein
MRKKLVYQEVRDCDVFFLVLRSFSVSVGEFCFARSHEENRGKQQIKSNKFCDGRDSIDFN